MKKNLGISSGGKAWMIFGNTCAIIWATISAVSSPFLLMMSGFAFDNPNNNFFVSLLGVLLILGFFIVGPWVYLWSSFQSWKWYNGKSNKLATYALLHPFIPFILVVAIIIFAAVSET